jgi:hypothetical protein
VKTSNVIAVGKYVLVEKIAEDRPTTALVIAGQSSHHNKGKILSVSGEVAHEKGLKGGDVIMYVRSAANRLGVGFPDSFYIVRIEDIVASVVS